MPEVAAPPQATQEPQAPLAPPPRAAEATEAKSGASAEPKSEAVKPAEPDRLAELAAQTKRIASERMKLGHEARKQREEAAKREESFAAREAKLKEWEAREADKKRNPAKYLAQDYGADWYDKLSQVKLSGGATPDLIASEVDDKVAAIRREFDEYKASVKKEWADRDQQAAAREREEYEANAVRHAKANADKYPLLHAFEVVGNIPAVIRAHFDETCSTDEQGRPVPGEVWSPEQAASEMEKVLSARVAAATKANTPPAATTTPAGAAQRPSPTQRRNLSTELTGTSTGTPVAASSEAERKARAAAAWDRVVAARQAAH